MREVEIRDRGDRGSLAIKNTKVRSEKEFVMMEL